MTAVQTFDGVCVCTHALHNTKCTQTSLPQYQHCCFLCGLLTDKRYSVPRCVLLIYVKERVLADYYYYLFIICVSMYENSGTYIQ